ncbi:MAG: tetratricopeptide repeat protein [Woeseiaceae bacterium]
MLYLNKRIIKSLFILLVVVFISACQISQTKPDTKKAAHNELNSETRQKYSYALQLMGAGNNDAAIKMLNDVSKLNDILSGPYANRGLIYLKLNNKDKAQQQFEYAIDRNEKNVTALNQLGILFREKKNFKQARINYEAALDIDKNHANAHLNLGVLCDIYLQDKPCALEHFKAYQALSGEDETVSNWIIDLKEQL